MTETVCQYRSTCLHFLLKQTSKTHSAQQAQAQWAHIDRRASVDRQSHNNSNKTLSFHKIGLKNQVSL